MDNDIYINKRIYYDYDVLETLSAGLVLYGWEVKQIKNRSFDISNAYVKINLISGFDVYLKNFKISIPSHLKFLVKNAGFRDIKLLLKKREILRMNDLLKKNKRSSFIVGKLFSNRNGLIKCDIVFVKGKKKFDKRNLEKIKELKRDIYHI